MKVHHTLDAVLSNYRGNIIGGPQQHWTADTLRRRVLDWMSTLRAHPALLNRTASVGVLMDNNPNWIAIDLAAALLDVVMVPLPDFFVREQLVHLVQEAQVGLLITDQPAMGAALGFSGLKTTHPTTLNVMGSNTDGWSTLPSGFNKVTFTSGTTGQPKGVCLRVDQQVGVAQALDAATRSLHIQHHLCLLPLAVLLENIAGVYAPLLANANIVCPPLAQTGLTGASQFDAQQCLNTIAQYQAESVIVLPQMLYALLMATEAQDARTRSLRFIAVGGGKVPKSLLTLAHQLGWPVFEGYGLSECASVVCLNTPQAQQAGSVGKPLDGVELRIAVDGEIWVKGRGFAGYLHDLKAGRGNTVAQGDWIPTGDLGRQDPAGYVCIDGRKKNLIITGFGRNVSPEWPESLLLATGFFLQAAVFGEGEATLTAVLVPRSPLRDAQLASALDQVNQQLPDYARITRTVVAAEPFQHHNGMATANGRIRREAIAQRYLAVSVNAPTEIQAA
ncbi:AMP-binding protein [Limnobacter humi]|uniref:AMP-binding protein n=1 Tax=Limnobacter humi TaxID=1778671 RepID=A0ABT1WJN0_9BURK|nr:AMP-binding protein [Limnobacter humi]MCQ8897710.1 AMP-binding protein [Limnobacter humi]